MKKIVSKILKSIPFLRMIKDCVSDFLISFDIRTKRSLINILLKNVSKDARPKNILFWSVGGMPDLSNIDATFALALKLRGHNVHIVICDGAYSACVKREIVDNEPIKNWPNLCALCKKVNTTMLKYFNLPFSYIGDWVTPEDIQIAKSESEKIDLNRLNDYVFDGIRIGPNIESSALRYLKGFDLESNPDIVRRYAESAIINLLASRRCLDSKNYDKVFMSHGIYIEWGPALKVALSKNITVTGWMSSVIPRHFILRNIISSETINVHHIDNQKLEEIKKFKITTVQRDQLSGYFIRTYKADMLLRTTLVESRKNELREHYGLNVEKKTWGILAHINWDGVKDGAAMVYDSFNQWITETIKVIQYVDDVNWLIKIHPAELHYNSPNNVENVIKQYFGKLPNHISIVPATSILTVSEFASLVDGAVTVYGTLGLEIAVSGKPIILAGNSHYSRKGFTYDAADANHYCQLLRSASSLHDLSEEQKSIAINYAYYFFLRRQIPAPIFEHDDVKIAKLNWDKLESLMPGCDPYMDLVCEGVINNGYFELNDEIFSKLISKNQNRQLLKLQQAVT